MKERKDVKDWLVVLSFTCDAEWVESKGNWKDSDWLL